MGSSLKKPPPPPGPAGPVSIGTPTPTARGDSSLQGVLASPGFPHLLCKVALFLPPGVLPALCRGTARSSDLLRAIRVDWVCEHPYMEGRRYWPPVLGHCGTGEDGGKDCTEDHGEGKPDDDVRGHEKGGRDGKATAELFPTPLVAVVCAVQGGAVHAAEPVQEDTDEQHNGGGDSKRDDQKEDRDELSSGTPLPTPTPTPTPSPTGACDLASFVVAARILAHDGIASLTPSPRSLPWCGVVSTPPHRRRRLMVPVGGTHGRNVACAWNRHAWSAPDASRVAVVGTDTMVRVYPETSLKVGVWQ